jgi:hypothetical protein
MIRREVEIMYRICCGRRSIIIQARGGAKRRRDRKERRGRHTQTWHV